jgi:cystathionine gamma-lyase
VGEATSFGGVHATAERRERVGDEVSPGLVRLSVGVEDTRDVLADLERGLAAAGAAPAA